MALTISTSFVSTSVHPHPVLTRDSSSSFIFPPSSPTSPPVSRPQTATGTSRGRAAMCRSRPVFSRRRGSTTASGPPSRRPAVCAPPSVRCCRSEAQWRARWWSQTIGPPWSPSTTPACCMYCRSCDERAASAIR